MRFLHIRAPFLGQYPLYVAIGWPWTIARHFGLRAALIQWTLIAIGINLIVIGYQLATGHHVTIW